MTPAVKITVIRDEVQTEVNADELLKLENGHHFAYLADPDALALGQLMQGLLYDGYTVHQALSEKARQRTGAGHVSDVLDALHRLAKEDKNR